MTQLTRRYHFFVTIAIDGDRDTVPSEAEVIDRLTTLLRRDVELNRVIVRSLGTDDHTGQITSSAGQSTTQWRHH